MFGHKLSLGALLLSVMSAAAQPTTHDKRQGNDDISEGEIACYYQKSFWTMTEKYQIFNIEGHETEMQEEIDRCGLAGKQVILAIGQTGKTVVQGRVRYGGHDSCLDGSMKKVLGDDVEPCQPNNMWNTEGPDYEDGDGD